MNLQSGKVSAYAESAYAESAYADTYQLRLQRTVLRCPNLFVSAQTDISLWLRVLRFDFLT